MTTMPAFPISWMFSCLFIDSVFLRRHPIQINRFWVTVVLRELLVPVAWDKWPRMVNFWKLSSCFKCTQHVCRCTKPIQNSNIYLLLWCTVYGNLIEVIKHNTGCLLQVKLNRKNRISTTIWTLNHFDVYSPSSTHQLSMGCYWQFHVWVAVHAGQSPSCSE